MSVTASSGGRFGVENAPLEFVLGIAFGVKNFQIVGAPRWVHSEPYDITAKTDRNLSLQQMTPLIQALLADRFKLKVHHETKDMPVYNLSPAKTGLNLTAKDGSCLIRDPGAPPPPRRPGEPMALYCGGYRMGRGLVDGGRVTMASFVGVLSSIFGRTVVDKTGFADTFDIHLQFVPDQIIADPIIGAPSRQAATSDAGAPATSSDSAGPSILTALQEQLGLRLESGRGSVDVLVIDSIARASPN